MKPLIGLTSNWEEPQLYAPSISCPSLYLGNVLKAGGFPVVLSAIMQEHGLEDTLDEFKGIIIIGGPDLDSNEWNEKPHPMNTPMKIRRQRFDDWLIKKAVEKNIPVLGICLGIQEINVALGGKLHYDIPCAFEDGEIPHRKKSGCSFTEHTANIAPDSLLHTIMGKDEVLVNSSHHQAISEVAPGLKAVAWSPDGVIEAVESTNAARIVAVQWHPEYLTDREEHLNLFRWIVNPTS